MAEKIREVVFDFDDTRINSNWIGARRLLKRGTKRSKKKLRRMDRTKMVPLSRIEKVSK